MPASVSAVADSVVAIVFILGSCIFIHELGHFVAARLMRMRVEEFMIGFPPRLLSIRRGETRYGVGMIPFGGYCKIAGMEPGQEQVEAGFYTKARYAQAFVLIAGVAMNVVLGVGVFTLTGVVKGVPIDHVNPPTIESLFRGDLPARRAGLQPGDVIVALDGRRESLEIRSVKPGSVGEELGLQPNEFIYGIDDEYLAVPADLMRIVREADGPVNLKLIPLPDSPQALAGEPKLIRGDRETLGLPDDPDAEATLEDLWGVEFSPLTVITTQAYVMDRPEQPIRMTVFRESAEIDITVTPRRESGQVEREDAQGNRIIERQEFGQIGISFEAVRRHDLGYALTTGWHDSIAIVKGVASMIYGALTGRGRFEGSGFVGIAYYAHKQAQIGWEAVLQLCGVISVNLAFLNLLPIPITDGGRLVLIGYESIVRRRIDPKREITWLLAGVVFFVLVFVAITFKDVWNLVKHHTP